MGNNVLNLITVLAGIENIAGDQASSVGPFGRENTTFAGVRADDIFDCSRRHPGAGRPLPERSLSVTTINPDLVGEIRLILAPVDVEIGRGNGTSISTRSGTNRYTGSAFGTSVTRSGSKRVGEQPNRSAFHTGSSPETVSRPRPTGRTSTRAQSALAAQSSGTRRSFSASFDFNLIDPALSRLSSC